MTGYLRSDTPEGIELVDSAGNLTPIPAADIADRYRSAMSLMPNGLAAGITAQELADVVAFLESLK
jgi:putative heme-binding domain-containing protein